MQATVISRKVTCMDYDTHAQSSNSSPASPVLRGIVVDDSPTVCNILEVLLRRCNIDVTCFPTAELALEYLFRLPQTGAPLPDFALIDIGLPGMDGIALIRHLTRKEQYAAIRPIILSRRDGLADRLKGRLAGAAVYLSKPFKAEDILETLRTLFPDKAADID